MFLSCLTLDPRSRAVRRDLANCQELHRTVMAALPQAPEGVPARDHFQVLYRVELPRRPGPVRLLVQSAVEPSWQHLPPGYLAREVEAKPLAELLGKLVDGLQLRFRVRANPTRKTGTSSKAERLSGSRQNGKRVPVAPDDLESWLKRRGEAGGFRVLQASQDVGPPKPDAWISRGTEVAGWRAVGETRRRLTFAAVQFDGRLEVTDAEGFRRTLAEGIGSGKAYGFGLLSVGPC